MYLASWPLAGKRVLRVISPILQAYYVKIVNRLLQFSSHEERFPGANPVSMMRRDLEELRNSLSLGWLVTEKSDGTRFLLLLTMSPQNAPIALLIDRSYGLYLLEGLLFADDLYQGGTIIDAELVQLEGLGSIRPGGEWRLLAFDLLIWSGNLLTKQPLGQRYAFLRQLLGSSYRPQPEQDIFVIEPKMFFPILNLNKMLEHYLPQLRHSSDGLIVMQENARYKPGMQSTILKWKETAKHTVDFLAHVHKALPENNGWLVGIYVVDSADKYVCANYITINREDLFAMQLQDIHELELSIIECGWSELLGWRPLRIRYDKNDGNSEFTLRKTVENIEENIGIDELLSIDSKILPQAKPKEDPVPYDNSLLEEFLDHL